MLQVRVRFLGPVLDIVKGEQVAVSLPKGATVQDLLVSLVDRYGSQFAQRVLASDGKPQNYVQMFINSTAVDRGSLDVSLTNDDASKVEVLFFVLLEVAGG